MRHYRKLAGLSQEQLAKKAKIGRITLSRIENGKLYAQTKTLTKIAAIFGIELADLLIGVTAQRVSRPEGMARLGARSRKSS